MLKSLLACMMLLVLPAAAAPRQEVPFDGPGWRVWLDEKAAWQDDALYAPGEVPALAQLPVNPPTGGWEVLGTAAGQACTLPASVEEICSGGINSWRYHGVSWFWRDLKVAKEWQGQRLVLKIGKARLRVEVYVDGQLAGYDLCCETPLAFDLTGKLKPGTVSRLAIRLTNPGGNRGWEDFPGVKWGKNELPASHDFAGLDDVRLVVTEPVCIENVFVKNLPPAGSRKIEVAVTVNNTTAATVTRDVEVQINGQNAKAIKEKVECKPGLSTVTLPLAAPKAKLWDMEHPNLYACEASLLATSPRTTCTDQLATRFGFRTFEMKATQEGHFFYLNGQRFRHKSAIDWGYYALTGFYATSEMARRSVENARAIGHTGINFHRRIGEPRVLDAADELGLYLYEEPGGFHCGGQGYNVKADTLAAKVMAEKVRRMVVRDRNHPSLLIYSLCNEDNAWTAPRQQSLLEINGLDSSRLAINSSSGLNRGELLDNIPHYRPYETQLRHDYRDTHTVSCASHFQDRDLLSHRDAEKEKALYWGEVRCYVGPADWINVAGMQARLPEGRPGYDINLYAPMSAKLTELFKDARMKRGGSVIRTPNDLSRQAASGLMYADGRLGQTCMANNTVSGYAINGWSSGPMLPDAWDSALCDEGRYLKGRAEDLAIWIRPLQIALFRKNDKWFKPGQTAILEAHLINEGILPAGDGQVGFKLRDGSGKLVKEWPARPVRIAGGDTFAQPLEELKIDLEPGWHAGHLTLEAELRNAAGKLLATGTEQLLLQNRPSWQPELAKAKIAVVNWPAAETAIQEAKTTTVPVETAKIILAGTPGNANLPIGELLSRVKAGATLILKFDPAWALLLQEQGILATPVTQWGGLQTGHWNGNGWGYIEQVVGNQAFPGKTVIGTNSWEVNGNPSGFWPFKSAYPISVQGAYVARPETSAGGKNHQIPEAELGSHPEAGLFSCSQYSLPALKLQVPNGAVKVTLRFCENHFAEPGKRIFDVKLQGRTAISKLDIFAKAGGKLKPLDLTVDTQVDNGTLDLVLRASVDKGCISAMILTGQDAAGKPWTRKICFGQDAWKDYAALRPAEWGSTENVSLLVLVGSIQYGKGTIVLAPTYPVDQNTAFSDLLFFNLIIKAAKKEW